MSEISTIITNFIDPQGRRSEASSQRGKPKPTEESQMSNNPPPPQISLRKIRAIDIPDDFRINIAKELKEKIETKHLPPRGQYLYEANKVLNDDQLEKLHGFAVTLVQKRLIDKNWDVMTLSGLLLFMLLSRPKHNIAERELALIEDSTDLQDMNGFISDPNVKVIFVRPNN
jgi:hypothetical protein